MAFTATNVAFYSVTGVAGLGLLSSGFEDLQRRRRRMGSEELDVGKRRDLELLDDYMGSPKSFERLYAWAKIAAGAALLSMTGVKIYKSI